MGMNPKKAGPPSKFVAKNSYQEEHAAFASLIYCTGSKRGKQRLAMD